VFRVIAAPHVQTVALNSAESSVKALEARVTQLEQALAAGEASHRTQIENLQAQHQDALTRLADDAKAMVQAGGVVFGSRCAVGHLCCLCLLYGRWLHKFE
jgi:hypothetical protein